MQTINLTPHPVRLYDEDTGILLATYEPSGQVARLSEEIRSYNIDGTANVVYGDVDGLDYVHPEVTYIVPLLVALARRDRVDLVFPYDQVRNDEGTVVGARSLGRVS